MTDRRRRPKASELAQDRRLIDPGYSFGARLPAVAAVEVTVTQTGEGVGGWNRDTVGVSTCRPSVRGKVR